MLERTLHLDLQLLLPLVASGCRCLLRALGGLRLLVLLGQCVVELGVEGPFLFDVGKWLAQVRRPRCNSVLRQQLLPVQRVRLGSRCRVLRSITRIFSYLELSGSRRRSSVLLGRGIILRIGN